MKRSPDARAREHGPRASVTPERFDEEADDASPQRARQYHDHWRGLLDLEWAEEEQAVNERLERWSLAKLEREGLCLTGLHYRSTGRFFDRLLYRFGTEPPGAQAPGAHPLCTDALKAELVELSGDSGALAVAVSE